MLDIRLIRERPDEVKRELAKVGVSAEQVDTVLAFDAERRSLITEVEALRARRAETSRLIGSQQGPERERLVLQMRGVGEEIAALEKRLWDAADQFRANSGLKAQESDLSKAALPRLKEAQVYFRR